VILDKLHARLRVGSITTVNRQGRTRRHHRHRRVPRPPRPGQHRQDHGPPQRPAPPHRPRPTRRRNRHRIHGYDVRIIHAATGEILRNLTINPEQRYHGTGAPTGGPRRPYGPAFAYAADARQNSTVAEMAVIDVAVDVGRSAAPVSSLN
jgi:hypothetical protein